MKAKSSRMVLVAAALIVALWAAWGFGPEEEGRHCVAAEGGNEAPRCFSTFRESISFATNGRVTDAPEEPGEAMRDEDFLRKLSPGPEGPPEEGGAADALWEGKDRTAEAEEVHVLALVFEHADYGGRSVGLLSASGCQEGESHRYPNLGRAWNDRASSVFVDVREGCGAVEIHQHADFRGRNFSIARQSDNLGGFWNDRTSSVTVEPLI